MSTPVCPTHTAEMLDVGDKWKCMVDGCKIIKRKTKMITMAEHEKILDAAIKQNEQDLAKEQAKVKSLEKKLHYVETTRSVTLTHAPTDPNRQVERPVKFYIDNYARRVGLLTHTKCDVDLSEFVTNVETTMDSVRIDRLGQYQPISVPGPMRARIILEVPL